MPHINAIVVTSLRYRSRAILYPQRTHHRNGGVTELTVVHAKGAGSIELRGPYVTMLGAN